MSHDCGALCCLRKNKGMNLYYREETVRDLSLCADVYSVYMRGLVAWTCSKTARPCNWLQGQSDLVFDWFIFLFGRRD